MKKLVGALGTIGVVVALLVGPSATQQAVSAGVPQVTVSGTPAVGSELTAVGADWGATPDSDTFEWLRDGEGDVLSRQATYVPTEADLDHTLVVVERVRMGDEQGDSSSTPLEVGPAQAVSPPAAGGSGAAPAPAPAAIVPAVNTKAPTVKGTAKVGKRLSVRSKGRWTAPGHSFRYQWLRNGKKIPKATKTSYQLTKKDRRKKITLRVSAVRSGYPTVTATSRATKKVR
ncbi:hypothetical protein [Aeromicrobium endophyticum]|uniref:Uncharacterized protein n=1 Tax=Aeromicrobium endophyticum TaxID=2292704 RepID=A0A371P8M7_9ACTN|nr:hypothetical protein [Aeromicrobium endophyticum]REK72279.1 hypothetical protein DX116_01155 [Aeromicrobium endophyticum]